jgi:hypothetical protein
MLTSTAHCLCRKVEITATNINPNFTVCHCDSCRTWGGAPFFAVQCGTDVTIKGREKVTTYESSDWALRGFCSECGTHLFYQLKKTGEYNMPVGMFTDLEDLSMDMQFFSDQRPNYYCFSNKTTEMTKAEVMDYFTTQG